MLFSTLKDGTVNNPKNKPKAYWILPTTGFTRIAIF